MFSLTQGEKHLDGSGGEWRPQVTALFGGRFSKPFG